MADVGSFLEGGFGFVLGFILVASTTINSFFCC